MFRQILIVSLAASIFGCDDGAATVTQPVDDTGAAPDSASNPDAATTPDARRMPDSTAPDASVDAPIDMRTPLPTGPFTFVVGESDGDIHTYVTTADGDLTLADTLASGGNLTFVAFAPDGANLYSTNGNEIHGFTLSGDGMLARNGAAQSGGRGTHLTVESTGTTIVAASYGDDLVAVHAIDANGAPEDASQILGGASDPNLCRRAHQARVHPNNGFAYVPCLASDHVAVFALGAGALTPLAPGPTPAGSGPRHMDFHPTLSIAYVINEVDDTLTVFAVDDSSGALSELQTVSTLPDGETQLGPASDVHVSPDGRFVYGINRNPRNEVVRFAVDGAGRLTLVDHIVTPGEHARTFAISPDGRYLYVGHSNSQDVVTYEVGTDGALAYVRTLDIFDSRVMFVGFAP